MPRKCVPATRIVRQLGVLFRHDAIGQNDVDVARALEDATVAVAQAPQVEDRRHRQLQRATAPTPVRRVHLAEQRQNVRLDQLLRSRNQLVPTGDGGQPRRLARARALDELIVERSG